MKFTLKEAAEDNMERKLTGLKIEKAARPISPDKIAQILDFLKDNYEIRINCFDNSKSYIKSTKRQYDFPVTFDDISLHLHQEGIVHNDTILRKILKSPNYIRTYNPITDYFESVRGKYKGESHIDILASHLVAKDFGNKPEGYYQKRLQQLLKKWITAMAATATGKYFNPVALGLLHFKEGIGKSFFFHFIVPSEIREFVCEFDPNRHDMIEIFARNALVLFDELLGINKRSAEVFKNAIQKQEIEVRLHHNSPPVMIKRMASAAFTSNRTADLGGFLSANMGFRRFGCIELEDIKHEYSTLVDVDQVWSEALMLADGGFNYVFGLDDFADFEEYNSRYLVETPAMQIIKLYYTQPQNGEGDWKQASEVLHDLVRSKRIRSDMIDSISPENIGYALKQLKFERKGIWSEETGTRYKYYVKPVI